MTKGPRDREAARLAALGFLASVGAIALAIWPLSHWLADVAIDPPVPEFTWPDYPEHVQIEDSKRDYRGVMSAAFAELAVLVAVYWALVFGLGAARLAGPGSARRRRPKLLLALALVSGVALAFLGAAPRFAVGPAVDACTRLYHAARPDDPCDDCAIHSCEDGVYTVLGLGGLLLMGGLMGWSLWLRYRLRERAAALP